ncbi:MAG: ribonucleoside-diphosphate reductase [Gammaproteobacteria bacterium SG8_47]|nr:MAG: ribonucleoside-diphosphate reductase [Gammaproteobacteria bacterium SG8_47]
MLEVVGTDYFSTAISEHIWNAKYRLRIGDEYVDDSVQDTWRRVADAVASIEPREQDRWAATFYALLESGRFLPGGRILAGAGSQRRVTLFNCFVMGALEDSLDGIFDALKQGALTMQQGGGVGYDFSTLRPRGAPARSVGAIASGPVSFMQIWDSMCATLLSTGARRGAMMATLRCDHPDIQLFIDAKRDPRALRHFNLSVLVSDAFIDAVNADTEWPLVFPVREGEEVGSDTVIQRVWSAEESPVACRVYSVVRARALWESVLLANYEYAEPGVLFVDRINAENNLHYRERISATNPCGEVPLPAFGACNLGSFNLTQFVVQPFTPSARLDLDELSTAVGVATRFMDNVIDLSEFPLAQQGEQARGSRRVGLGLTGLADTLIMLGLHYDSDEARAFAARIMQRICHNAYRTSIDLAKEKGAFPYFDLQPYLRARFVTRLPDELRAAIAAHGIRNSHLTAIAPTGTISLLANNVSSGLEPVFAFDSRRRVLETDGSSTEYVVRDYAAQRWQAQRKDEPWPAHFVEARELSPLAHLGMQAALQPYVDNAISKTINVPADYGFDAFKRLYDLAYEMGLKGCTTFRPNPVTGAVLEPAAASAQAAAHCCGIEREPD